MGAKRKIRGGGGGHWKKFQQGGRTPKIVLSDKGGCLKKHKLVFKSSILSDYPDQK